ncbi:MAG: ABC transporter permease [Carbonactinosporaceae bacterium]
MSIVELLWHWLTQPENWTGPDGIPVRFGQHLWYSGLSLVIAALVALPVGLVTGHTGRGGFLAINSANAARALPTIGIVILVVIFVGIGLLPVLAALVALAIPAVLVNTYEGIRTVDPELREAAYGMGLTGSQVLWRVELPVALPLVLLGMRQAAIQIVSTATIAAYVGLGGLGRYIFDGLARQDYEIVVGGAALAALLAVVAEVAFVLAARAAVSPGVRQRAR